MSNFLADGPNVRCLAGDQVGCYVHIPFCAQKCHYCDFVIAVGSESRFKTDFFDALNQECAHYRAAQGVRKFDTIYWGGGTPSLLTVPECRRVVDALTLCATWDATAEFTFEMNPDDVVAQKLHSLRDMGVNRISLGVQSLNDALLKAMGRSHDAGMALKAMEQIRSSGFDNLSADLILRLPGQTVTDVERAVKGCIASGVAQIVLYDLAVHPKTWFGILKQRGGLNLPVEEEHLSLYDAAVALLETAGFRQYEVSSFAKPGFESRHNLIYWNNGEYLGLGPGAFSYRNRARYQLAGSVPEYIRKCLAGDFVPAEHDSIDDATELRESFFTGLRLTEGVDVGRYARHLATVKAPVAEYLKEGCLEVVAGRIRLTPKGRRVAESIFSDLI